MNSIDLQLRSQVRNELARVVEPLASYICATERPREILLSALSALFEEVQATNRDALMHFSSRRVGQLDLVA